MPGVLSSSEALQISLHLLNDRRDVHLRLGAGFAVKALQSLIDDFLNVPVFFEPLARFLTPLLPPQLIESTVNESLPLHPIHLVKRIHHLPKPLGQCEVEKTCLLIGVEPHEKLIEPSAEAHFAPL